MSITVGIEVDLNGNDRAMLRRVELVEGGVDRLTDTYAAILRRKVINNASTGHNAAHSRHLQGTGPGPNIVTGAYVASIKLQKGTSAIGVATDSVFTDSEYGARLEFGFVGVDALGRYYHQPPFPHWTPAIDAVEKEYVASLENLCDGLGAAGFVGITGIG